MVLGRVPDSLVLYATNYYMINFLSVYGSNQKGNLNVWSCSCDSAI